jgi:hypothetical protein
MLFNVYLVGELFLSIWEINSAPLKIYVPPCHLGKESSSVLYHHRFTERVHRASARWEQTRYRSIHMHPVQFYVQRASKPQLHVKLRGNKFL